MSIPMVAPTFQAFIIIYFTSLGDLIKEQAVKYMCSIKIAGSFLQRQFMH